MSKLVFRNSNTKAIRQILKNIGKEEYDNALNEVGLREQPPITMQGFYLEFTVDTKEIDICYRYPSGIRFKLISALGYWEIPNQGWEMVWELTERKLLK